MTKRERAEIYQQHLTDEGYKANLDDDGDVVLKSEGRTYVIVLDDDEEYFRLIYPNFWAIESEMELTDAAFAADTATSCTKVAKVFLSRRNVSASIEMFVSSADQIRAVFTRSLGALRASEFHFRLEMRQRKDQRRDTTPDSGNSFIPDMLPDVGSSLN